MNYDAILRQTLESGGGTFAVDGTPITGTTGFMVGIGRNMTQTVSLDDLEGFPEAVRAVLKAVAFSDNPIRVGTWIYGGNIEIDPVIWVENKEDAVIIGRFYGQKAIWDMNKQETVFI